jgi:hypothetical protein
MTAAGAALVEQKGVITLGIEQRPMGVLRAAAWAAVQEDDRTAALAADLLDVEPMSVANRDHAGVKRAEWSGCVHHLSQWPVCPGTRKRGLGGKKRRSALEQSSAFGNHRRACLPFTNC